MQEKTRISLIISLCLISLGGFLLHLRIHPVFIEGSLEWEHSIPAIIGIAGVIIIPCLFLKEATAELAYLLTGLSVIFGAILMTHLSIATWSEELALSNLLLKTTLADSLILFAKFFIAKAVFETYYPERAKLNWQFPQGFRFLFDGWWLLHFIAIAAVYSLGVVFLGY